MAAAVSRLVAGVWMRVPTVSLPAKMKGGRMERWGEYWVNVGRDYKDSFITIGQQMKERPLKSAVYITAMGSALYLNDTNPTQRDLRNRLQQHLNTSATLSSKARSPASDAKINHLIDCFNNETIRHLNLVFFSLAWQDNYNSECAAYKATVKHLKPRYLTFFQTRVLDVGVLGRWWHLEHIVASIDINENEWDDAGNQRPGYGPVKSATLGML